MVRQRGKKPSTCMSLIFKIAKINGLSRYTKPGPGPAGRGQVMTDHFGLDGCGFVALNGGPHLQDHAGRFVCRQLRDAGGGWLFLEASRRAARNSSAAGCRTNSACPGRSSDPHRRVDDKRQRPTARQSDEGDFSNDQAGHCRNERGVRRLRAPEPEEDGDMIRSCNGAGTVGRGGGRHRFTCYPTRSTRPDNFSIARSATIKAPPDKIYGIVSDFRQWPNW